MTNSEIKQILVGKQINNLYHSNTVETSITFLRHGGLLSRGAVEQNGLNQTPQKSDKIDKQLGIYNDIFFDSVDIHERAHRINSYGPILFVYSINLIDELPEGVIGITKDNPIRWRPEMTEDEKYFATSSELSMEYHKGTFKQHFTIRNWNTPLPFTYLNKIIIDNPKRDDNTLFDTAKKEIEKIKTEFNINIPLIVRDCSVMCSCHKIYSSFSNRDIFENFKII